MKRSAASALTVLLCGAMIASASACATGVTYPLTIDGEQIRAGIYILKQQDAVDSAKSKLSEEQPDLDTSAEGFDYKAQTVEGKSFSDWVDAKTTETCREYIAVERLFSEYGLSVPQDKVSNINSTASSLWTEENMYAQYFYGVDILGEYYEKLGVGQQSFKDVNMNDEKEDELFDYLYGEGGPKEMPAAEIDAKIKENYAAISYFEYTLTSGEGAQHYADIAKDISYEEAYRQFSEASEREELEAAVAAAAAAGEEYLGKNPDEVSAELGEADSFMQIVSADSTTPSEDFIKQVFEMPDGEIKVITVTTGEGDSASTQEYVVSKADVLTKPELTESYRHTVVHDAKKDEFEALIKEKGDSYSLSVDSSKTMYKIDKLLS